MSGVIVEVSARKFAVPYECPCCGAAPDTEIRVPAPRTPGHERARSVDFPYCKPCVAHASRWESAGLVSSGVMLAGIVIAVIVTLAARIWFGLIAIAAAIPIALLLAAVRRKQAKAACGPSCAGPGNAVLYLGWSGTASSFSFESLTYTARFAERNSNLVNVSATLRRILDGHRVARIAAPTPAAAMTTIPRPLDVHDWVARLEAPQGRIARRNTLGTALDSVHEPGEHDQLIAVACKAELQPVLDKLARLSSPAQKKAHLKDALADVQADNIPDRLQDAELRELEKRLAELG